MREMKIILIMLAVVVMTCSYGFGASITLEWQANPESFLKGYYIYYKADVCCDPYSGSVADQGPSPIKVPLNTPGFEPENPEYTLTGLDDNRAYYFTVTAYSGEEESGYSNEVRLKAPQIISQPVVTYVSNNSATIEWATDIPGNSEVRYGPSETDWSSYAFITVANPAGVTAHSVTLTGLDPDTEYHFRIGSTNDLGFGPALEIDDQNPSGDNVFTTQPDLTPDTTPPQFLVQPYATSITDSSASIKWETDETANRLVEYGLTTLYGNTLSDSDTYTTLHVQDLSGLDINTLYHARVTSTDQAGNQITSSDFTFMTASTVDTDAPIFTSPPTPTAISNTSVTIEWVTNEPSSTKLRYGTEPANWSTYPSRSSDFNRVTHHTVTITGLESDTLYYYRAASADATPNQTVSAEFTFRTTTDVDNVPPDITSVPTIIAKTDTTATIAWNTDEPANSSVHYWDASWSGPRTWDNIQFTKNSSGLVTSHSVTLTNLTDQTQYYVLVGSSDAAGNGPTISSELTFVTEETPDTDAPQITSPPTITSKSNQTVTIEWVTDEPSNSIVQYGNSSSSWGSYPFNYFDPQGVTHHRVVLAGLDSETLYYFRVGGNDAFNNGPDTKPDDSNPSVETTVLTDPDPDFTAPQITSPPTVTAKTNSVAVIEWGTDEPSTSIVRYGTVSGEWDTYLLIQTDPDMVVMHTVTLVGLDAAQKYYYRVGSVDERGNGPDSSPEFFFTTDESADIASPRITVPPTVTGITDMSATIEWETDEPSNSLVKYLIGPESGDEPTLFWEDNSLSVVSTNPMVTRHSVTLTNLEAGNRYFFMVGSVDAAGNGPDPEDADSNNPFTQEFFTTEIAKDENAPKIISGPVVSAKDNDSAIIEWETDEPSNSIVRFDTSARTWFELTYGTPDTGLEVCYIDFDGQEDCYPVDDDGNKLEEVTFRSESDSELVTHHRVTITGLQPSTSYYYRVGSTDVLGNGPDLNQDATNPSVLGEFATEEGPDILAPFISALRVYFVTNTTALITWETDEPSNSLVQYGIMSDEWDDYLFEEGDSVMEKSHSITITGLQPSTSYYFRAGSTDANGNGPWLNARESNPSDEATFVSADGPDVSAPQISGLSIQSLSGATALISWTTDEPGNSQVRYDTGRGVWQDYQFGESDAGMTTEHSVVITGLSPSTLYYLRVSSTDASGNNWETSGTDANPSIERILTTGDADPPSIIQYPSADYPDKIPAVNADDNYIEITYDEPNMQNATGEAYYLFSPLLSFSVPGNSIEEISTSGSTSTYHLYFDAVEAYTVYHLTVTEEITDADGYPVEPDSVVINDNDGDDLPDDWEIAYGLDPTSTDTSEGEGRTGDFDQDGYNNYDEFINNTDPLDAASNPDPPGILDSVPHHRAGIDDNSRIPNNASFGIYILDANGIDVSNNSSLVFTVDDKTTPAYDVDLGDISVIRIVKMDDGEPDTMVTAFWCVYDRSLDTLGAYPFDEIVDIQVSVVNNNAYVNSGDYQFRIETESEHNDASADPTIPEFSSIDAGDQDLDDATHAYNSGFQVDAGVMQGAKIIYHDSESIPPELAPTDGIPVFLDSGLVNGIGGLINVQPPTIFSTPVKLMIPTQGEDAARIQIYVYNGVWTLASDIDGSSDLPGWMVPGSRVNNTDAIEFKVYHFSGVHAAVLGTSNVGGGGGSDDIEPPEDDLGSCFVTTAFAH